MSFVKITMNDLIKLSRMWISTISASFLSTKATSMVLSASESSSLQLDYPFACLYALTVILLAFVLSLKSPSLLIFVFFDLTLEAFDFYFRFLLWLSFYLL